MTAVRSTAAAALVIGGLMCATAACGGEASGAAAREAAEKSATAPGTTNWQEPSSYTFTLESSEGERMLIGTFRVTVRGGEVVKALGLDESGRRVVRQAPDAVPTIGELLEELEQARRDKADTAEARYTADGRPTRISLDWEANAVDDEALYVISAYGPAR
jgi:hypothetical protein